VKKILLIAFGSKGGDSADSEVIQAKRIQRIRERSRWPYRELFVFHDSAGVNLLAAQFELRLE